MAVPVNVPNVPGVPAVVFAPNAGAAIALLTKDAISSFGGSPQQWGIFSGGSAVITADTVGSFDYRQQWSLSDYPVEEGAFETYDKVQTPFDARFRFASGGSEANREALLNSIAAIAGDLNLYDVVTPEAVYQSVNVTHYDYSRTAVNGVGLMTVDVWTLEVREAPSSTMSNTQSPSDAAQTNGGSVQPTAPTSTQAAAASTIAGPPSDFPGQP